MSPENIQSLIDADSITPNTLVWKSGMNSWSVMTDTELKELFPNDLPPPIPPNYSLTPPPLPSTSANNSPPHNISIEINQLETWFKVYWICLAAGIPLCIIIVGFAAVITSFIFSLIMLHKFWQTIQDGQVRTTPGKAVGFQFIPFFNFYWVFIAYWGLAKDMNRYVRLEKSQ